LEFVLNIEHSQKVSQMNTTTQASARLIELINEAAKCAGNQSALAEIVGETRHNLSAWKRGRPCPLEAQIIMGSLANRDVEQIMKEAVLERNEGTARGEKLKSALKKGSSVAGAAALLTTFGGDALALNLPGLLRCISWLL
jgi:hypothetical protein